MINTPETIYESLQNELKLIVKNSNAIIYEADLKVSSEKEGGALLEKLFWKPVERCANVVADSLNQMNSYWIERGILKSSDTKKYSGEELLVNDFIPNYSAFEATTALFGAAYPDNFKKLIQNPKILNDLKKDFRYKIASKKEQESLLVSLCVLLVGNKCVDSKYIKRMSFEMEKLFLKKCEGKINFNNLDVTVDIDTSILYSERKLRYTITVKGGKAPYKYSIRSKKNDGKWRTIRDFTEDSSLSTGLSRKISSVSSGTHIYCFRIKDANGKIVEAYRTVDVR